MSELLAVFIGFVWGSVCMLCTYWLASVMYPPYRGE